jgi:hypothetical protein
VLIGCRLVGYSPGLSYAQLPHCGSSLLVGGLPRGSALATLGGLTRHDPGAQMRWSRAGARRCTRPSPVRSDRMWSLPISPAAAIIYESIHSGALNGTVGTPCGGGRRRRASTTYRAARRVPRARAARAAPRTAERTHAAREPPGARVALKRCDRPALVGLQSRCALSTIEPRRTSSLLTL